ncbi:MAG: response regulator [Elusimicrobia bacterium]|nr:response regulator [Elusimicrobiota bacterium]
MSKKILVVDDEPDTTAFLTALLTDNGYAAFSAADGDEAKKLLDHEKPDLVLLDIVMPNKSGVRLYREMKETPELKAIPVLFVSGLADFKIFMQKIRPLPDPQDFVEKPLDEKTVLDAVRRVLAE